MHGSTSSPRRLPAALGTPQTHPNPRPLRTIIPVAIVALLSWGAQNALGGIDSRGPNNVDLAAADNRGLAPPPLVNSRSQIADPRPGDRQDVDRHQGPDQFPWLDIDTSRTFFSTRVLPSIHSRHTAILAVVATLRV